MPTQEVLLFSTRYFCGTLYSVPGPGTIPKKDLIGKSSNVIILRLPQKVFPLEGSRPSTSP